jgi:hypothetical protein
VVLENLECQRLRKYMTVYSVLFSAHGKVLVRGSRRRQSIVAEGHAEDSEKNETTVKLTQGDSRAMVNSFKLYIFHAD